MYLLCSLYKNVFSEEKGEDQSSVCFNYIIASSSLDFYDVRPYATDHKESFLLHEEKL